MCSSCHMAWLPSAVGDLPGSSPRKKEARNPRFPFRLWHCADSKGRNFAVPTQGPGCLTLSSQSYFKLHFAYPRNGSAAGTRVLFGYAALRLSLLTQAGVQACPAGTPACPGGAGQPARFFWRGASLGGVRGLGSCAFAALGPLSGLSFILLPATCKPFCPLTAAKLFSKRPGEPNSGRSDSTARQERWSLRTGHPSSIWL